MRPSQDRLTTPGKQDCASYTRVLNLLERRPWVCSQHCCVSETYSHMWPESFSQASMRASGAYQLRRKMKNIFAMRKTMHLNFFGRFYSCFMQRVFTSAFCFFSPPCNHMKLRNHCRASLVMFFVSRNLLLPHFKNLLLFDGVRFFLFLLPARRRLLYVLAETLYPGGSSTFFPLVFRLRQHILLVAKL